jgi:hypothetical protein
MSYSVKGTSNDFTEAAEEKGLSQFDGLIRENAQQMIEEGRRIFRFDTFGDEAFWGDTLKLHQAIACAGKGSFMAHPTHLLGRHKDEYCWYWKITRGSPQRLPCKNQRGNHQRHGRRSIAVTKSSMTYQ